MNKRAERLPSAEGDDGYSIVAGDGGYRYGFNGKEKDENGEGGSAYYDYGFRIYDPAVARFLSVDPLTRQYPMLTPYQFASNRPIDGIDLDGLEYYTIHVAVHNGTGKSVMKVEDHTSMNDAQIQEIHGMPAKMFYSQYSKTFGSLGRGVLYVLHHYDADGKYVGAERQMQLGQDGFGSSTERHGIFYGKESITYTGLVEGYQPPTEMAAANDYDFSKAPIDEVDALAKEHDIAYAALAEGYQGWFEDERTGRSRH